MFLLIAIILVFIIYTVQNLIYKKSWDRGFKVSAKFSKKCINEGDKALVVEEVINAKKISLPSITVKLDTTKNFKFCLDANANVSDKCYVKNIFSLLPYQKVERSLEFVALKRGYYELKNIDIVFTNFFSDKDHTKRINNHDYIYVFPKNINPIDFPRKLNLMVGNFISQQFINEDPFEFRGIREYQPYDNFTSINWKSSARMSKLMVNQNYSTSSLKVTLILNTELNNEYTKSEALEHAIRITSTLANNFIKQGIAINLMITNSSEEDKKLTQEFDSSQNHLFEINKRLAKTEFTNENNDCISLLNDTDKNNLVILISSYRKSDLCDYFSNLGDNYTWIVPCEIREELEGRMKGIKNIIRWEMKE